MLWVALPGSVVYGRPRILVLVGDVPALLDEFLHLGSIPLVRCLVHRKLLDPVRTSSEEMHKKASNPFVLNNKTLICVDTRLRGCFEHMCAIKW